MWVRGLKRPTRPFVVSSIRSHPMWVRGLKPTLPPPAPTSSQVAPYVGAWIETSRLSDLLRYGKSHPMWVRGLKLRCRHDGNPLYSRTLCGCVDWNYLCAEKNVSRAVAPYVGAWIETLDYNGFDEPSSRTLCGCVDWNQTQSTILHQTHSRTLCGCVDWNFLTLKPV